MSPARQQVRPTCAPHCAAKRPAPRRHPSVRPAWREKRPSVQAESGYRRLHRRAGDRRAGARFHVPGTTWSHETLSRLKAMSLWSMSASSVRACRLSSSHSSILSALPLVDQLWKLVFLRALLNSRELCLRRSTRTSFLGLSQALRRAQPTEQMARSERTPEPDLPPPTVHFERQMFSADAEVRGGRPSFASPHSGAFLPKVVPRAHRP